MANSFQGLRPDGSLPSVARAEVEQIVQDHGGGGGSGVEEVSGVVTLSPDGPRIREFYTVGTTTIEGEEFPTDMALAVRRTASGEFQVAVVGESGGWRAFGDEPVDPDPGDTIPPTAGTLSVTVTEDTISGTVSGAMDDVSLHSAPYRFSRDGGSTWSEWQAATEFVWDGLTPATEYQVVHEVRDSSGNTRVGAVQSVATAPVPVWDVVFTEDFDKPDGSLLGVTTTTGGLTWAGGDLQVQGGRLTTVKPYGSGYVTLPEGARGHVRIHADYHVPSNAADSFRVGVGMTTAGGIGRLVALAPSKVTGKGHPESGTVTFEWDPATATLTATIGGDVIDTFEGSPDYTEAQTVIITPWSSSTNRVTLDNLVVEVNTA